MDRMTIIIIAVLAIIVSAALAGIAFAQEGSGSAIAHSSVFYDLWTVVQPLAALLVTTVGPILVMWISARLIALLKITDQKQQVELEAKLRDALHQSAANALKYALAKAGLPPILTGVVSSGVLGDAIAYVEEKNPEALTKLGVHPDALRDIILSKLPDLLARVPQLRQ